VTTNGEESKPPERTRAWLKPVTASIFGLAVLIVLGWAVDSTVHRDSVARGVSAGGISLSGFTEDEVRFAAEELTRSLASSRFTLNVDGIAVATNPVELGAEVDPDALAAAALDARRGGFVPFRPFRWVGTLFSEVELDLEYRSDEARVAGAVDDVTFNLLEPPIEPRMRWGVNEVVFVPGSPGKTISTSELSQALPTTLAAGEPYSLAVNSFDVSPVTDPAALVSTTEEINEALRWPMQVQVADSVVELSPKQLARWINLIHSPEPGWEVDERRAIAELEPLFTALGAPDQQPQFVVVMDRPLIAPARETLRCCGPGTGDALRTGLLGDRAPSETPPNPVLLNTRTTTGQVGMDELRKLGVVEQVSTFTTNHPCCRNRVENIHLFADTIKGTVILPGQEMSLNETVGMRTPEGGYLPDGAISKGVLEPQVGGGVSQVASTFFSTAFFAGLDFEEYQSHSLYFSRYERGREATISWPKPDLRVANFTDYAVLVWTSYTSTSVSVSMYSTDYIDVQEIGRQESAIGECTKVTTTRERTYPNDVVVSDTVFAVYRPGEGLDCNGDPTN
jgi:vancomycin resistance protein YoaR